MPLKSSCGGAGAGLYDRIYDLVAKIPRRRVISYGQIARIVGRCTPRQVGYAMAATPWWRGIPWQRVINSRGEVSPRRHGAGHVSQRELLEKEGVVFDARGRVDLDRYGWAGPPTKIGGETMRFTKAQPDRVESRGLRLDRARGLCVAPAHAAPIDGLDSLSSVTLLRALDYLEIRPAELGFEKLYADDDTFRLTIVETLLNDPLKIPGWQKGEVERARARVRDPVALVGYLGDLVEAPERPRDRRRRTRGSAIRPDARPGPGCRLRSIDSSPRFARPRSRSMPLSRV